MCLCTLINESKGKVVLKHRQISLQKGNGLLSGCLTHLYSLPLYLEEAIGQ